MNVVEQVGNGTLRTNKTNLKKQRKYKQNLVDICNKFEKLGWRKSFIKKFRSEHVDFDFEGELDEYWMQCAVDKAYSENINTHSFTDLLCNIGLKKSVAKYIWNIIIEPVYDTCYTEEQLFDIAIEHVFGKTKPLFGNTSYYLNLPTENEWYYHKKTKGFAINYNESVEIKDIIRTLDQKRNNAPQNLSERDKFYLFHCTSWRAAKSIIKNGVNLDHGRQCLDFGIKRGFYMSKDIMIAQKWGEKKKGGWGNEIAIIIFELTYSQMTNYKVKMFENANKDWIHLVKRSRKCKDEKNILDTFDFVYGPICKNPKDVAKKGVNPVPFDNRFQFVAKSRESETLLENNYIGCIWKRNCMK